MSYVAEVHPTEHTVISVVVADSIEWCQVNIPGQVQTGTTPGIEPEDPDIPVYTPTYWLETSDPYTTPGTLVYCGPGYGADPGVPERFCSEHWDAVLAQNQQQDPETGTWSWTHNTQGELVFHNTKIWRNLLPTGTPNVWEPGVANWREYTMGAKHPVWLQPVGSVDAYPINFIVEHNALVWQSLHPANVWEPGSVGAETLWEEIVEP